ncbi:MAG: site-specific integrase [Proteobacteria bacterium]|nr:site-specific integrase [Pseudomonadota bacterium]MBU4355629.1 site-specific integrase [Pseudomonadota bacterium]
MPKQQRYKTNYPGVFFIEGTSAGGKSERIYYIVYRKHGKLIEEKAGRQFKDDMIPARASKVRTQRIEGDLPTNRERREAANQSQELWTINRLWEEYIGNRPMKGIAQDRCRFEKYIQLVWGNKEPHEILPLEVDRLRLRSLKDKAPQTVKNTLALLRRIVNFGVRKRLCQSLTFTIEMPNVNNLKTEDLNPEQLTALLEAIEQDPNIQASNFMRMVLFTGMRRGELFKLRWEDVDFDRGFIHIRWDPKGGQDQKIPLNQPARDLLQNHPRSGSAYVFPGRGGRQRVDINKQVNRIKNQAGLPKDFRALHGLRHVYASMLASSGQVDLFVLQKLLTHKSAAMTQRYAHLRDDALKQASNIAGAIIKKATNCIGNNKLDELRKNK